MSLETKQSIVRFFLHALFVLSVFVFMAIIYNAVQGQPLDLNGFQLWTLDPGALIAAGIVTLTWIFNGLSLKLRMSESRLDWYIKALMTVIGLAVDVVFVASLILRFSLHPLMPLLVVIGHGVSHALHWVITSWEIEHRDGGVLSDSYQSPEQRAIDAEKKLALAEQERDRAKEDARKASQQATRLLEDANRVYEAACKGCGRVFAKPTQEQANAAVDGHRRACKVKSNGHSKQPIPAKEQ